MDDSKALARRLPAKGHHIIGKLKPFDGNVLEVENSFKEESPPQDYSSPLYSLATYLLSHSKEFEGCKGRLLRFTMAIDFDGEIISRHFLPVYVTLKE
jgi:hypothetical protein